MINLNKLLGLSGKKPSGDRVCGATDIGKIRENNEDCFLIDKENQFFIISDGMGGHNAGEVASSTATKTVAAHFSQRLMTEIRDHDERIRDEIINSIQKAHSKLHEMASRHPDYKGMGCTIVVSWVIDGFLHIAHIGDSRAYLSDGQNINLLTTDHTYVMQLVKAGKMTMDDIRTSNIKNHLSQALGAPISIVPDYSHIRLKEHDKILLCTDGLWDNLSDREIFNILNQNKNKDQICKDFIRRANRKGGYDNITVVVYEYTKNQREGDREGSDGENAGEYGIVYSFPSVDADQ